MEGRCQHAAVLNVIAVALSFSGCTEATGPVQPLSPTVSQPEFFVEGAVIDTASRPLADSRVEVVDGARAGTVARTDQSGRFSLPGTFAGPVTLAASKEGYTPQSRRLPPSRPPERQYGAQDGARWSVGFSLEPIGPSVDATGDYALTLTADRACSLPEQTRTRTYTARVAAVGRSAFQARLSDARFFSTVPCEPGRPPETCTYNWLGIGIAGDYASIYVGVIEVLDDAYLVITGGTAGTFNPAGVAWPLSGAFLYCPREPFLIDQGTWACPNAEGVECESGQHQLALVRR
jgi:hypothetical protein